MLRRNKRLRTLQHFRGNFAAGSSFYCVKAT